MIHNGIENPEFLEKSEARKRIAADLQDKIWVGTIAELHPNKGLEYALASISLLKNPDVFFICIGEGQEKAADCRHLLRILPQRW